QQRYPNALATLLIHFMSRYLSGMPLFGSLYQDVFCAMNDIQLIKLRQHGERCFTVAHAKPASNTVLGQQVITWHNRLVAVTVQVINQVAERFILNFNPARAPINDLVNIYRLCDGHATARTDSCTLTSA